jgi:hypothetical protein
MPSTSYRRWTTIRSSALDEIANAHSAVGGTGPGRRYATQQINQAYAVLLASQFQGFCRDLAHQDFDPAKLGGSVQLQLAQVRRWRVACNAMAQSFDEGIRLHLQTVTGNSPW